jgi:two-component system chemotaxis response regulator CheY
MLVLSGGQSAQRNDNYCCQRKSHLLFSLRQPAAEAVAMIDTSKPVLVVDDFVTMTRIAENFLRKCGFTQIDQVHNVESALKLLAGKEYLFVLADVEMQGRSGIELLRLVKSNPKLREVRVIMTSARLASPAIALAKTIGADGFLVKPFAVTALNDTLTGIFSQKR